MKYMYMIRKEQPLTHTHTRTRTHAHTLSVQIDLMSRGIFLQKGKKQVRILNFEFLLKP